MTETPTEVELVQKLHELGPLGLMMDPAVTARPQPAYKTLREACPVARGGDGFLGGGMAVFFRHGDIEEALRDPARFSSRFGIGDTGLGNDRPLIPLQIDPPDHKKYRVLLDPLFAPKKMERLDADIAVLVNELIDGFIDDGRCEFNNDFAVPLPCIVFLRLMGLPVEDLDVLLRLKDGIIRGNGELDPGTQGRARAAAGRECYDYFGAILDERQRAPRDDMLSLFLQAEVEGKRLTRDEILDVCYLFLIAGLDTVTDSLTCFFHTLAARTDLRRRLVEQPEVVPAAVEELLRWESPVPSVVRIATQDLEIEGCPIKAGDAVLLSLGSANTDETAIAGADEIDFDRQANRHYAFGGGIHRCLGSHLARRELRVALHEWHRRIPDYHVPAEADLRWAPLLRQVENLPLVFDTAPARAGGARRAGAPQQR